MSFHFKLMHKSMLSFQISSTYINWALKEQQLEPTYKYYLNIALS